MKVIGFSLLLTLFISLHAAFAFEGEAKLRVLFPAEEKTSSDLYLTGWRVTSEGEVNGNLFVLGGNVHIRGPVHGNVYAAGGTITIDGPVDGDVNAIGFTTDAKASSRACRLLALDVGHEGKTSGDLLALGGMVTTRDEVHGDALLGGWWINLGGQRRGRLKVIGRNVTVSGTQTGDSEIDADSITLDHSSHFNGDLTYTSAEVLDIPSAQIKGNLTHNYPSPQLPTGLRFGWVYVLSHKLFSALWLTVVGLVSLTWFPRSSQSVVDTMLHFPWESFFGGLLLMVALPGIAFILVVSFLGIPLGIFLFAVFGIAVYLTRLFGSLYIGERILGALEHHMPPYWQSLPLGVFLFTLFTSIPYVGYAVSLVVIPLALGAKALLGWRVYRRMRQRHLA